MSYVYACTLFTQFKSDLFPFSITVLLIISMYTLVVIVMVVVVIVDKFTCKPCALKSRDQTRETSGR